MGKHFILGSHITGVYDVNRRTILPDNDFSLVAEWVNSIARVGLQGILFHNNFSSETCQKHQTEHLQFIEIKQDRRFKPNVYRYFVYRDFLRTHANEIEGLFVTDVSDVVVINNPFEQALFKKQPHSLFCGDEPKSLNNTWMREHGTHLRKKIADYSKYEAQFKSETLLNCGIIGGHIGVMQPFIEQLSSLHEHYNYDNQSAYTGDMGAFNYIARTRFNQAIVHGPPVNTEFKAYQTDRVDCWFRHK